MALFKKAGSRYWHYDLTSPDGERVRGSTKTANKQLAAQIETRLRNEMVEDAALGIKRNRPFKDAVDHYLLSRSDRRNLAEYARQLRWWEEQIGKTPLYQVDEALIYSIVEKKQKAGVANATLNRYLAILRAALRAAHLERKWIKSVPRIVKFSEPKARVRFLTPAECERLIESVPAHWRGMVRLSLATGLRQRNVLRMRWDWVNLESKTLLIPGSEFKNKQDFALPLNDEAVAAIRAEVGRHDTYVFTYSGEPMSNVDHAGWKAACERAGIFDFRWHDLRHTWASRLARSGVPTQALQRLGGWETMAMVNKYAHLDVDSLRQYVDNPATQSTAQLRPMKGKPYLVKTA
jgi:integrase